MKRPLPYIVIAAAAVGLTGFIYAQAPFLFTFLQRGGPGPGPNREERKILKEYDVDDSGWLNSSERAVARKALQSSGGEQGRDGGPGRGGPGGRGRGGRGGPGGPGGGRGPTTEVGKPGPAVAVADVEVYEGNSLYDTGVLRTLFLEFENEDWEIELEDFHGTDVDVAATLTVDGKTYPNVGVHFRGASSYGHVSRGSKRSFNVSMNHVDKDQRLDGYKTLNLLNCHGDPSMMSTVLYSHIASQYVPTPKANFVHVVVNGESWGLYDNVQQFDKKFLAENFNGSKGTRWKVSGSPNGDGGMRYLGDDLEPYKERFEMKSNDGKKEWAALIELCQTLNETPDEQLVAALEPILNIDGVLKFLALDVVLVNSDGYWTRASDYNLFRDDEGKFHVVPHDMNEAFALSGHGGGPGGPGRGPGPGGPEGRGDRGGRSDDLRGGPEGRGGRDGDRRGGPDGRGGRDGDRRGGFDGFGPPPGGPGGRGPGDRGPGGPGGGPGHGGVDLDPLIGIDNDRMPLRSRLLAIPELRERYLKFVAQISEESLSWQKLGPVVNSHRELISELVAADTRKLTSTDAFLAATATELAEGEQMSLRKFSEERTAFLAKEQ